MARKKVEFRPDSTGASLISKLYITPSQRKKLYRWLSYSAICIALLVIQDVILWKVNILGGTIDIVPAAIILVCVMEGAEAGGMFALWASIFYYYSGSAPGAYCIALMVLPSVAVAMFRQSYLRRGFVSHWLCTAAATAAYQLGVFAMALFFANTFFDRWLSFAMNAGLSLLALPVVYPLMNAVSQIGGDKWKE